MTMVPSQNLSKHHQLHYCGGYVGYCGGSYAQEGEEYYETAVAGSLLGRYNLAAHNPMAEDESRTTTTTTNTTGASLNNNNEAMASSSRDIRDEDNDGWLQLSIGTSSAKTSTPADASTTTTPRGRGGGELDLLLIPTASRKDERVISQENTPNFQVPLRQAPSFLFQAVAGSSSTTVVPPSPPPTHHRLHQEINWTFRPAVLSIGKTNSSSNPPSFMQLGPYFAGTQFQLHGGGGNVAGPSLDFRVIDPPRRPHPGIWFSLQASQYQ